MVPNAGLYVGIQFKIKDEIMLWGMPTGPPRTSDPKIKDSFISQVKVSVHQFASDYVT